MAFEVIFQEDMDKRRFGNLLRSRREAGELDVSELAQRVGLSREVLGKYERGERINPIDPEYANAIAAELKNVSVLELVMAMGYQVSVAGLASDELALIDQYRRLSPASRAALQAGARALVGMLPGEDERPKPPRAAS